MSYKSVVLADSPLSLWMLDETSGTNAADSGSASNAGTYANCTLNQAGNGAGILASAGFNGSTSQVSAALSLSGRVSVSLECWFYCTDLSITEQMLIYDGAPGSGGYALVVNGNSTTAGHLYGLFQGVRWFDSTFVCQANTWYHVVLVLDGVGHPTVYVNGVSVYSDSGSIPNTATTGTSIGQQGSNTRPFKGRIAAAATYNAALTATQVDTHYVAGAPAPQPKTLWKLNESSGTTAADLADSVPGTYSGGFTLGQSTGVSGAPVGVALNGSSGQVASSTLVLSGNSYASLECWFKVTNPSTGGIQTVIYNGNDSGGYGLLVSGAAHLEVLFGTVRFIDTGVIVLANTWYHVVLTLNTAGKPTVYVNGSSVFSDTGTNAITPAGTVSAVGNEPGQSRFLGGTLTQAAFYNFTLSAKQVAALYTSVTSANAANVNAPMVMGHMM